MYVQDHSITNDLAPGIVLHAPECCASSWQIMMCLRTGCYRTIGFALSICMDLVLPGLLFAFAPQVVLLHLLNRPTSAFFLQQRYWSFALLTSIHSPSIARPLFLHHLGPPTSFSPPEPSAVPYESRCVARTSAALSIMSSGIATTFRLTQSAGRKLTGHRARGDTHEVSAPPWR